MKNVINVKAKRKENLEFSKCIKMSFNRFKTSKKKPNKKKFNY